MSTKPTAALRAAAFDCGVGPEFDTVEQIEAKHRRLRHPKFADQFDCRLEELIDREKTGTTVAKGNRPPCKRDARGRRR